MTTSSAGSATKRHGNTSLEDRQVVDSETLDYSRLEAGKTYLIELVTPLVLRSGYPGADDRSVPGWWAETRADLQFREETILLVR